jgi:hypothetical protein
MPRIEDSLFQDEVANSLLGDEAQQQAPEQEPSEYAVHGDDLLNEAIVEQAEDPIRWDSEHRERVERLRSEREDREPREPQTQEQPEREERQAAQPQEHAQTQQMAEPSPAQIREAIQQLDAVSEQFQLNEGSREFVSALEPLLGPEVYKNEAEISNAVSRYTIGAREDVLRQINSKGYFDANEASPLSQGMVREGARAVASFFGINPQLTPLHDERRVAEFMRLGLANFANTWGQSNGKTPVSELNDGDLAVWIVQNIAHGLTGTTEPVNRKWAIDFVNAITDRESKLLPKIRQGLEGGSPQKQPRARGQRIPAQFREGIRGSKVPKFRSNVDIFSGEAVEAAMSQKL